MRALVVLVLVLLPSVCGANDLGLTVGPVEEVDGAVTVSYRAETPLTPRLEETLLSGMPATVTFEVGLWKRRAFWFDKLVLAIKREHKVIYDPWGKAFRLRSGLSRKRPLAVPSLDSLKSLLFAERQLPLVPTAALSPEAGYYVSTRVTIRPLTAEDLGEVEDWLTGDANNPERPRRGVPGYLLGIAVSFSGLGDRTALAKSETFRPSLLEAPQ
jgi:uncharacterized protein DUF4390